ncbi:uncharacterized protein LOC110833353 [Zootermopsis nevadensis]|uniref:Uncharacterized protein n=1 Tax=Zootermopsis nevadensis TaxID=136037 RepID=A0A067R144_ZOONE|nr:uncharacterized protein LOC110833353 [Zootermopsis nevadensis]XP_021927016.1 uncharacterized protein LOC110833353 [Zootermopsis nevadensis]KDR15649.1 hypothetical protein L798_09725 [Zootermopsis nevadensis]
MRAKRLVAGTAVVLQLVFLLGTPPLSVAAPSPQESLFEFPVQLVGFPVIILAVRLTNFVKKLAYSLNPRTYTSRTRRSLAFKEPPLDVAAVEKRLVAEMGEHVCVFEQVCHQYAEHARTKRGSNHVLDWDQVIKGYEGFPTNDKRNYLLSVFLGDIVASPGLCHQLAKRGRGCTRIPPARQPDHVARDNSH